MTRRTGDWPLVGYETDPVPADQSDVDDVAGDYRDRADALALAHETLSNLSSLSGWTGDAAEKFAETADDGLGDIAKARDKYADAASALESFADAVLTARLDTAAGLREAEDAEAVRRANDVDGLAGVDDPTEAQQDAQDGRDEAASDARDAIGAAATKVQNAVSALEEAARTAADSIDAASESFDDGWFDDFKGWVRDNADVLRMIVKILEYVAIAIAAIGLILALTIGAPFALIVAGIVAAVLILAVDAALVAAGEESWTKLVWDTIGLALSIFGGKLALNAMRQLGRLAPATTRAMDEVATVASRMLPQNVKNALNITNPNNPLFQWARTQQDDAVRAAQQGLQEILDRAAPRVGDVVRTLDQNAATALAQMRALQGRFPNLASITDDLDQVAVGVRNTVLGNWTGTIGGIDAFLDQVSPVSISDGVQAGMAELQEEMSELHWRIKTVL